MAGNSPERPDAARGRNVILILVDQERHFDTYPFPVPGRERLMAEGTMFENHDNCSNVCTSSRSVLYTGWHMPVTGMFDNVGLPWMTNDLDPALGTIGSLFRQAGYYTAYKGKWHLSNEMERGNLGGGRLDIGLQPTAHIHAVMDGYGFGDYHGIGDVIGWSQGGYLYDGIDGRYKFARYFSPRQHNSPRSMDDLLRFNDVELFDTKDDPDENHNLAASPAENADLIMRMNARLETLIASEIGPDKGDFLPLSGLQTWAVDVAIE